MTRPDKGWASLTDKEWLLRQPLRRPTEAEWELIRTTYPLDLLSRTSIVTGVWEPWVWVATGPVEPRPVLGTRAIMIVSPRHTWVPGWGWGHCEIRVLPRLEGEEMWMVPSWTAHTPSGRITYKGEPFCDVLGSAEEAVRLTEHLYRTDYKPESKKRWTAVTLNPLAEKGRRHAIRRDGCLYTYMESITRAQELADLLNKAEEES